MGSMGISRVPRRGLFAVRDGHSGHPQPLPQLREQLGMSHSLAKGGESCQPSLLPESSICRIQSSSHFVLQGIKAIKCASEPASLPPSCCGLTGSAVPFYRFLPPSWPDSMLGAIASQAELPHSKSLSFAC